jgi:NADH dehydrogenase [ubiquinone] 1 alpha subcomplex assembly factor 5
MRFVLHSARSLPRRSYVIAGLHTPRTYATISPHTPPPQTPYEVYDEPSKFRQRDRALLRLRENMKDAEADNTGGKGLGVVDYLREELAERLAERVEVR